MQVKILLIACTTLSIVVATAGSDGDSKFIQSKDYEFYLQRTKSAASKSCAVNEMAAYGLTADVTSLSDPNPICPQMQGNCCGAKDQELIKTYWESDNRHQAGYHIAYLNMNKYVLGNVKNYLSIASDILSKSNKLKFQGKDKIQASGDKSAGAPAAEPDDGKPYTFEYHPMCEDAAKQFIHLDFVDRQKAQGFYDLLNRKAEFMQNARRGFYCMLCNAKSKDYISTNRFLIKSKLWYSRDFCQMIYSQAFSSVYMVYKSFNPFIKSLLRMLMCIKPKTASSGTGPQAAQPQQNNDKGAQATASVTVTASTSAPFSMTMDLKVKDPIKKMPEAARKIFENPMGLKSQTWLEICYNSDPTGVFFGLKCMGFCENFKMTKRSKLLDGNLDTMQTVYDQLLAYEFALPSTTANIFDIDILSLKRGIHVELTYLRHNYNFYRSLSPRINFSKYSTQFSLIFKGINPMALSAGTNLEFKYKFAGLLHAAVATVLSLVLFK